MEQGFANIGLIVAYLLIGIAVLAMIVFPIMHLVKNPKRAKYTLFGIGGIVVLFLLSFLIASSDVLPGYEKYGVGSTEAKIIDAALITLYILGFGAIALAIFSEVSKLTK